MLNTHLLGSRLLHDLPIEESTSTNRRIQNLDLPASRKMLMRRLARLSSLIGVGAHHIIAIACRELLVDPELGARPAWDELAGRVDREAGRNEGRNGGRAVCD